MKILITGSSGTIGTRLCEVLMKEKVEIIGIDKKKNKWQKSVDKNTIIGDLRSKKAFSKLPKKIDMVVHLAANARVYELVENPDLAKDNFITLYNTLEFCRKNNIKKFMFASSREVYGNTKNIIHKEEDADIINCESPYSASKIGGEALIHAYKECYGIDFIIVRFSNVYGMYDESNRVIPLFIRLAKKNKDLVIFGKEKLLDFTYIDDTISAVINCIKKFDSVKNDTYNISFGRGIRIFDVAKLVKQNLKSKSKIILSENRTGEVIKYIADISKISKKVSFKPKTPIEEGVKKAIGWYGM